MLSDYFDLRAKPSVGQGAFYVLFPFKISRKAFIFFQSKKQIYEIYATKEDGVFHGAGKQESADGHPIYESIPSSDGTIPQENSDVNDDVQNQHVPSFKISMFLRTSCFTALLFVAQLTFYPFVRIQIFQGCFANQTFLVHSYHLVKIHLIKGYYVQKQVLLLIPYTYF